MTTPFSTRPDSLETKAPYKFFTYLLTCTAPHMPPLRRCASQRGPLFSLGHSSSLCSRTLARSYTAASSPSLQFFNSL